MPTITSFSDCDTMTKLDGRTKEARLLKTLRSELVQHVSGSPSITQRLLIDQACRLRVGLASMRSTDDLFLEWSNSLAQLIQQIEKAAQAKPAPAEAA